MSIARFQFNAWARYPDWQKDNRIPERVAAKFDIPLVPVNQQNRGVVLEGGSIDVNGQGTLLTTGIMKRFFDDIWVLRKCCG
jgi:agmatine deiminase